MNRPRLTAPALTAHPGGIIPDVSTAADREVEMQKLIVIGGVAGGATAATRGRHCCPDAEIILYDRGAYVSYVG